jgi:WD40 repeat protein
MHDYLLLAIYINNYRLLCTGDFVFSSSYDKTIKAWLFDTTELDEGTEDKACIRTFKGHSKGVYPLIFIPAEESLVLLSQEDGPVINPGDLLISGSADATARSWSFDTGGCLKVFKGHGGAITTMATDTQGKVLYTAGADATIKSWNVATGQTIKVLSELSISPF